MNMKEKLNKLLGELYIEVRSQIKNDGSELVKIMYLTKAIKATLRQVSFTHNTWDIHSEIAIIWGIGDIQLQYPTLTDDEAFTVLIYLEDDHDCTEGITLDVIDRVVKGLYPDAKTHEDGTI